MHHIYIFLNKSKFLNKIYNLSLPRCLREFSIFFFLSESTHNYTINTHIPRAHRKVETITKTTDALINITKQQQQKKLNHKYIHKDSNRAKLKIKNKKKMVSCERILTCCNDVDVTEMESVDIQRKNKWEAEQPGTVNGKWRVELIFFSLSTILFLYRSILYF